VILTIAGVVTLASMAAGMLLGDTNLLLGDLTNWLTGQSGPAITFLLDSPGCPGCSSASSPASR
jgi:ferric hydroxamate transport system permease protein